MNDHSINKNISQNGDIKTNQEIRDTKANKCHETINLFPPTFEYQL